MMVVFKVVVVVVLVLRGTVERFGVCRAESFTPYISQAQAGCRLAIR